jgi:hypothetical protein
MQSGQQPADSDTQKFVGSGAVITGKSEALRRFHGEVVLTKGEASYEDDSMLLSGKGPLNGQFSTTRPRHSRR